MLNGCSLLVVVAGAAPLFLPGLRRAQSVQSGRRHRVQGVPLPPGTHGLVVS